MSRLVDSLGWTLVHFAWQGALIAALTALAFAIFRNSRPKLRYLIGCLALLACVAWPMLEFAQRWQAYTRYASAQGAGQVLQQLMLSDDPYVMLREYMGWIVALWSCGSILFALRMGAGLFWVRRLTRAGSSELAGLRARLDGLTAAAGLSGIGLRIVDGLDGGPLAVGFLRPVVIVPASLVTGMSPQLLDALLAHELGHIRHHDYLVNLLQNAVETLLFYHPAVWWLSARVRAERELMADDFAARLLDDPRTVALALSELEKSRFQAQAIAQAATGGQLAQRVRRLVMPKAQGLNLAALAPVLGALLAGMTVYANAAVVSAHANRLPVAVFSSCQRPIYPQESLDKADQGTVVIGLRISADGHVLSSRINRSSGHRPLDRAARSAIEKCRFDPGLVNGKPTEMNTHLQYVWMLE
jgi:D-alanyl-D-alanine endopeptidase (penicillin-binding protein 7)